MKKTTLTRFDNENIVVVEIENQEGTAKIIDEVNNTVVDIGGGGGVTNPVIEITFINNTGSDQGPYLYIINEDEICAVQFVIANGETKVIDAAVIPASFDGPEGPFTYRVDLWQMECTKTASDAVNCAYYSGDDILKLTDTSENGSITLTLS